MHASTTVAQLLARLCWDLLIITCKLTCQLLRLLIHLSTLARFPSVCLLREPTNAGLFLCRGRRTVGGSGYYLVFDRLIARLRLLFALMSS